MRQQYFLYKLINKSTNKLRGYVVGKTTSPLGKQYLIVDDTKKTYLLEISIVSEGKFYLQPYEMSAS